MLISILPKPPAPGIPALSPLGRECIKECHPWDPALKWGNALLLLRSTTDPLGHRQALDWLQPSLAKKRGSERGEDQEGQFAEKRVVGTL